MTTLQAPPDQFTQLAGEILKMGSCLRFKALGSSMTPFIRNGDVLTIIPGTVSDIQIGDIAFYRTTGQHTVAHRVLGKKITAEQTLLTIRGDASAGPYEWIPASRILGRAIQFERHGKTFRLDTPSARLAGRLWAALQPLGRFLILARYKAKRFLHPGK